MAIVGGIVDQRLGDDEGAVVGGEREMTGTGGIRDEVEGDRDHRAGDVPDQFRLLVGVFRPAATGDRLGLMIIQDSTPYGWLDR
ncbi:hypothetical protein [Jiangella endophytica]|uniref:hypothetical protein n=1 Tax=Jiangella endophytica TaxID=1623398 RepID=UPI00130089D0|nr:hypothetical protein [Jiangella endophytica]